MRGPGRPLPQFFLDEMCLKISTERFNNSYVVVKFYIAFRYVIGLLELEKTDTQDGNRKLERIA